MTIRTVPGAPPHEWRGTRTGGGFAVARAAPALTWGGSGTCGPENMPQGRVAPPLGVGGLRDRSGQNSISADS